MKYNNLNYICCNKYYLSKNSLKMNHLILDDDTNGINPFAPRNNSSQILT